MAVLLPELPGAHMVGWVEEHWCTMHTKGTQAEPWLPTCSFSCVLSSMRPMISDRLSTPPCTQATAVTEQHLSLQRWSQH